MAGPIIPAPDGGSGIHPPARCSLIDSPTATHREVEIQLTAVSGCADPTTEGDLHGRVGDPLTITIPACGAVMTVVPTATQVPMAVQDTPVREAEVARTV